MRRRLDKKAPPNKNKRTTEGSGIEGPTPDVVPPPVLLFTPPVFPPPGKFFISECSFRARLADSAIDKSYERLTFAFSEVEITKSPQEYAKEENARGESTEKGSLDLDSKKELENPAGTMSKSSIRFEEVPNLSDVVMVTACKEQSGMRQTLRKNFTMTRDYFSLLSLATLKSGDKQRAF